MKFVLLSQTTPLTIFGASYPGRMEALELLEKKEKYIL